MDFTFRNPRILSTAHRIHALSADLLAIESGQPPTARQLRDAPLISNWILGHRPEPILIGDVIGHPGIADGPAFTSGLYYADPERGIARTLSRWYRLGPQRPVPEVGDTEVV